MMKKKKKSYCFGRVLAKRHANAAFDVELIHGAAAAPVSCFYCYVSPGCCWSGAVFGGFDIGRSSSSANWRWSEVASLEDNPRARFWILRGKGRGYCVIWIVNQVHICCWVSEKEREKTVILVKRRELAKVMLWRWFGKG